MKKKKHPRPKRVYPYTKLKTWVLPRSITETFCTNASNTPVVCQQQTIETVSNIVLNDYVTYGPNVPNWKENIQLGRSATTVLSGVKSTARMPVGSASSFSNASPPVYCAYGSAYGNITGMKLTMVIPPTAANSDAEAKARSKLLGSLINAKNTWRGGNFLAEIDDTVRMFLHPVRSCYQSVWDFAGIVNGLKKFRRRIVYTKHLADAWLAWSFGVKPLFQDLNDAASALNKLSNGFNYDRRPVKGGGATNEIFTTSDEQLTAAGPGDLWYAPIRKWIHYEVQYRGEIKAQLENTAFLFEQFGIGVFDVVPAIWEGIPWSFFIDYFANVGEMLDSMRIANVDFAWGNRRVRNTGESVVGSPYRVAVPGTTYFNVVNCGAARGRVVSVSRSPIESFPYPSWRFTMPFSGLTRALNIGALVRQVQGSKPPPFLK